MKIYSNILIILLVELSQVESKQKFKRSQIIQPITDVVRELFIKSEIKFDTIIYGNFSPHLKSVVDGVEKNLRDENLKGKIEKSFESQIIQIGSPKEWNHFIFRSALILVGKDEKDKDFFKYWKLTNQYPKRLKFLLYFENEEWNFFKYELISSFKVGHLTHFAYFLTRNKNGITLWTNEEFEENSCNKLQKVKIDSFTQKWKNDLKIPEKFQNFHNCPIRLVCEYSTPYCYMKDKEITGIIPEIIKPASVRGNINPKFLIYAIDPKNILDFQPRQEFKLQDVLMMFLSSVCHSTVTFLPSRLVFEMTPPDKFTNWEKVLLPFDFDTWKFLLITFGVSFLFVFVINQLPNFIKDLVYGENVRVPAYNIVGTFFGIGQIKLPEGNFARILLMIFILFCLIIRTAYQGK
jgi:hypothetical protein